MLASIATEYAPPVARPPTAPAPSARPLVVPDHVPREWVQERERGRGTQPGGERDVALDLVRGLAILLLVVNHTHLESALSVITGSVISAAEVLVAVSGVVVGMVFGRRWLSHGGRETTLMLLRRSRKLYAASVVVVAIVGALTLVPGLATDALAISPTAEPARNAYAFESFPQALLAIVTLGAGPWQFAIMGFFVAVLALAPAVLHALSRGRWAAVIALSWAIWGGGYALNVDVLPFRSEYAFPILSWQLLFVHGVVVGWHRHAIGDWLARGRRSVGAVASIAVLALAAGLLQTLGPALAGPGEFAAWERDWFDKGPLDPVRLVAMVSLTAAAYLLLRGLGPRMKAAVGYVLLPLGRNSFYIFILHVFACLAIASALAPLGDNAGLAGNTLIQLAALTLLVVAARNRFLFSLIPR